MRSFGFGSPVAVFRADAARAAGAGSAAGPAMPPGATTFARSGWGSERIGIEANERDRRHRLVDYGRFAFDRGRQPIARTDGRLLVVTEPWLCTLTPVQAFSCRISAPGFFTRRYIPNVVA
jgi:hypothetical protein